MIKEFAEQVSVKIAGAKVNTSISSRKELSAKRKSHEWTRGETLEPTQFVMLAAQTLSDHQTLSRGGETQQDSSKHRHR